MVMFKLLLRNIWEKKFRTILIFFSVAVLTALLFATSAISNTTREMTIKQLRQLSGNSDFHLFASTMAPSPWLSLKGANKLKDKIEYAIGSIEQNAMAEYGSGQQENIVVLGVDMANYQLMNPVVFVSENKGANFSGNQIIISQDNAERHNLSIGDYVTLFIEKTVRKVKIYGICYPDGIFYDESYFDFILLPHKTMSTIVGANGQYSTVYIKAGEGIDKGLLLMELIEQNQNAVVFESVPPELIENQSGALSTSLLIMTVVVALMVGFIIYSSFTVIIYERLSTFGVLRSIGATKSSTTRVLLSEGLLYGIFGGVLGLGLGIVTLYLIAFSVTPEWQRGLGVVMSFNLFNILGSFAVAVIVPVVCSLLSIKETSKMSIKEIVLKELNDESGAKRKVWPLIISILSMTVAFFIPRVIPYSIALPVDIACIILVVVGCILAVPYLIRAFLKVFGRLFALLFGNEAIIAADHVRHDKRITTNVSILAVGIASIFMINVVTSSTIYELQEYYNIVAKFDLIVYGQNINNDVLRVVAGFNGVDDAHGVYSLYNVEVEDKNYAITKIEGSKNGELLKYWDYQIDNKDEIMEQLDDGRNIILNIMLKGVLNVETGDTISLLFEKGFIDYSVIGFMNVNTEGGSYAITSEKYLKIDGSLTTFSEIYVSTSIDPFECGQKLNQKYNDVIAGSVTIQELATMDYDSNKQIFDILNAFSILTILIGMLSMMNHIIISFLKRKRSLAVYRSIGMSKGKVGKMLLLEAIMAGLIGGTTGLAGGSLLTAIMPLLLRSQMLRVIIHYSASIFVFCFIAGVLINIVASLNPLFRASRLNIIEEVRMD